jgi:muramoyltetrapeptide carboxypeptidase LdcA involved in peptidoglycan recycling
MLPTRLAAPVAGFQVWSADAPPPSTVARALRSYAAMGMLQRLGGLLFGRPSGGLPASQFSAHEQVILQMLREEEGLTQLPVISRVDFGHSDPMCVSPIGGLMRIDCSSQQLTLMEACVQD